MRLFTPERNPTVFRKIAISIWRRSNNPQILGDIDIDFTAAGHFIRQYGARFGVRITPTHLVGRAVGLVLAAYPEANAKIAFSRLYRRNSADVYFNVLAADQRDLAGVRLSAVDKTSLAGIVEGLGGRTRKIRTGADKGFRRGRSLFRSLPVPVMRFGFWLASLADDLIGIDLGWAGYPHDPFGGAVISSGGMGGLDSGYGALPPVAHCALFFVVMPVRDRPFVVDNRVEPRPVLRICGTFDHRIVDGHVSGLIATELKSLLADPESLLTDEERARWDEVPETPSEPGAAVVSG